ncbi:hypothetical protein B0H12DRAFT_1080020 [Mycena haematopus]|nr:hypothetical protein B0H12DRAFT_1080020 [Mycena haematopus]
MAINMGIKSKHPPCAVLALICPVSKAQYYLQHLWYSRHNTQTKLQRQRAAASASADDPTPGANTATLQYSAFRDLVPHICHTMFGRESAHNWDGGYGDTGVRTFLLFLFADFVLCRVAVYLEGEEVSIFPRKDEAAAEFPLLNGGAEEHERFGLEGAPSMCNQLEE